MPSDQMQIRRWRGGQHPSLSTITRLMQSEGLRPYLWTNTPNQRQAVRSHGYNKVLYVVDGQLEAIFPDSNQRVKMRSGDRLDVPKGVRHGAIVGSSGVKCLEAIITARQQRVKR